MYSKTKAMTKKASLLFAAFAMFLPGVAVAAVPSLKVQDVRINPDEKAGKLEVEIDLNMKDYKLGRTGEVIFTPVVYSENGNDSVVMSPVVICGRSRYYLYMREGALDHGKTGIYRSGTSETVKINENISLEPWMLENATVEMRQQAASCCGTPELLPGNSANGNVLIASIHDPQPKLDCEYIFSPPMEDEPVKKSYEGKAFVTFVVNRTELNPNYMNNPAELRKITNTIDIVKSDPDAIITEIHIRGYASPEGSYANNTRLAHGRTETLANYVNSLYRFAPGIMTTSFDPEDWSGLRTYVADSLYLDLNNRSSILNVIDSSLDYDERDATLKRLYPHDYQILLTRVYPWLRHSDYAVKYQIKVYSDLENLNRLYNSDPTKLRPVDFYTIAQQYPVGSSQYLDVMKKAGEVYPDHQMINLNVANIYMMEGDYDKAQSCLLKAGQTPQGNYARGVLAAKRQDYAEAQKWFRLASQEGISQATRYLNQIEEASRNDRVNILIPLTSK